MTAGAAESAGPSRPGPSPAALAAAREIARRVSVLPIYSHALGESFAEIIERHTQCRNLVAACRLAQAALNQREFYTESAQREREIAAAALAKVLSTLPMEN